MMTFFISPTGMAKSEQKAMKQGRREAQRTLTADLQSQIQAVPWPPFIDDPTGGEPYKLKQWPTRQIASAVGTIHVKVPAYWKKGRPALMPHQPMFGLRGSVSPMLVKISASLAVEIPFATAANELHDLKGCELSRETLRLVAEALGASALEEQLDPHLPHAFATPARIAVFLDGGRVRTDQGWKEPRLARIELTASNGHTRTHVLSRIASAEDFWRLLEPLLERLGARQCPQLAVIGDGAPWILAEAQRRFPHATTILDFFHAAQHIHAAARAIFGRDEAAANRWARPVVRHLKKGQVASVLNELRIARAQATGATFTDLDREFEYLSTRRTQMAYRRFRQAGWPIGSGKIEALVKQALNLRLKRNGAGWRVARAEQMLALRAAKIFGHFDAVWTRHISRLTAAIPAPLAQLLAPATSNPRAA